MEEVRRDGDEVQVRVSTLELRALLGALNEALNGAYAIPEDEWEPLVGQPAAAAEELADSLMTILER